LNTSVVPGPVGAPLLPLPDVPLLEVPVVDVPVPDVPLLEVPVVDVPLPDVPVVDVPLPDVPVVDVPLLLVPVVDVPLPLVVVLVLVLPVPDEPLLVVLVVLVVVPVEVTVEVGAVTATVAFAEAEVPAELTQVRVNVCAAVNAVVVSVPVGDSLPVQPPEPVQLVTPVDDQVSFEVEPLVTVVGVALIVTVGVVAAVSGPMTETPKGGRSALVVPSLVLIVIFRYEPTSLAAGVPVSWPVVALKLAHRGELRTLKVSAALL
jgi:hypothetical protein